MTAFPVIVGLSSSIVFFVLLIKLVQRNRLLRNRDSSALDRQTVSRDTGLEESWSDSWFEDFSAFRYLPMRRLLSSEEEAFWVQSTEATEFHRTEYRAERRRVFRQYLQLIASDFSRLSQGVRLAVVHAPEDRSADIDRLLHLEWNLRKLLWRAEVSLTLHWLGVKPVDATKLIDALQGFEFSLREMRMHGSAA